ncbi:MAG: ABC transporter ATP-binding protein [Muribaculaceae bacterium]|nr:ABC transporter ATP-binding protein [Muribaculaceae bacterium]
MRHINLTLHKGEMVLLLGANGVGKSTLLRTLSGAQPPLSGTVTLCGKSLSAYKPRDISRIISIVYTDRTHAGALTVEELVSLGRQPHTGFFGRMDAHDRKIVDQAMEATGIIHKANCHTADLSDGERQKAMIAKAIAQEAPIIILDEPTAFLDTASRLDILSMLKSMAHDHGRSVLLSTHDISSALPLADRLWILSADRTASEGTLPTMESNGSIDRIFSCPGIHFDRHRGDFVIES